MLWPSDQMTASLAVGSTAIPRFTSSQAHRVFFFDMLWRGTGTVASDSGTSMVVGRSVISRRGGPLQLRALDTYGSGDVYSFQYALALVLSLRPPHSHFGSRISFFSVCGGSWLMSFYEFRHGSARYR